MGLSAVRGRLGRWTPLPAVPHPAQNPRLPRPRSPAPEQLLSASQAASPAPFSCSERLPSCCLLRAGHPLCTCALGISAPLLRHLLYCF